MTLYADLDFYVNYSRNGQILDEPSRIPFYLHKAQKVIKSFTFDNIDESTDIPYEVKMCQCEIAEILFQDDKRAELSQGVISESVGGWSKHYESSEQIEAQVQDKIKKCVYTWLSDTGLLYCGVKRC